MLEVMTAEQVKAYRHDTWGRDYRNSDDGYDDMSNAQDDGYRARSSWGSRGWDLGEWPYLAYYFRDTDGAYELLEICEGDHSRWIFPTAEHRAAAVDYIFSRSNGWEHVQAMIDAGTITANGWRGAYVPNRVAV